MPTTIVDAMKGTRRTQKALRRSEEMDLFFLGPTTGQRISKGCAYRRTDHCKGICPTQPGRAFLRVMISEARVHLAGTRSTDWRAPRAGGAATQQKRGTRRTIEPERTSAAAAPASSRLRA